MEFSTFTADIGAWALDGLPEGPLQVAFFREDYQPDSREVTLTPGEELRLSDVLLRASPGEAATVTGRILLPTGAGASQATVRAVAPARSVIASSGDEGRFTLGPVPAGVYLLGVERPGSVSVSSANACSSPAPKSSAISRSSMARRGPSSSTPARCALPSMPEHLSMPVSPTRAPPRRWRLRLRNSRCRRTRRGRTSRRVRPAAALQRRRLLPDRHAPRRRERF